MDSAFFGLTPTYRAGLFRQIHEIIFHGNGGYNYDTIYNMPVWLRNTTFKLINEYFEKQNEENKQASKGDNNTNQTLVGKDGKVNVQDFKAASQQYTKTSYK